MLYVVGLFVSIRLTVVELCLVDVCVVWQALRFCLCFGAAVEVFWRCG